MHRHTLFEPRKLAKDYGGEEIFERRCVRAYGVTEDEMLTQGYGVVDCRLVIGGGLPAGYHGDSRRCYIESGYLEERLQKTGPMAVARRLGSLERASG